MTVAAFSQAPDTIKSSEITDKVVVAMMHHAKANNSFPQELHVNPNQWAEYVIALTGITPAKDQKVIFVNMKVLSDDKVARNNFTLE